MLSYSIRWMLKQNYVKGPHFHENLKELLGDGKTKRLVLQSWWNGNIRIFDVNGAGIFNVDGEKWKNQRKMASHMFSATEFRNKMTTTFRSHAEELLHVGLTNFVTFNLSSWPNEDLYRGFVQKFESAKENQTTLDAHDLFHRFTLDSIGEIAFGVNIQSMVQPDTPFAKSFNQYVALFSRRQSPLYLTRLPQSSIHRGETIFQPLLEAPVLF